MTIDPDSYEPAYVQLAGILRTAIERGELAPGAVVPSEASLVQQHGVSRETARRAIGLLRNEGLIVTAPGRGSYVRDVSPADVVYVGRDVQVTTRMPSAPERKRLGLSEGTPVLVVTRPGEAEKVLPGDRTVIAFDD